MAKRSGGPDSYGEYLDARGPGRVPCPCCGYRTLHEGPGDYDVCRICFWEDSGEQLRWPTLADGQPNSDSLLEAQRRFLEFESRQVGQELDGRGPKPGEEREPDWRPLDPDLDDFESGPDDPGNVPHPEDPETLYWWRPTYFRRPENKRTGPAPRRPPASPAEQMMARVLEVAPETAPIDLEVRSQWERPHVGAFCRGLVPFVVKAVMEGDTELALRVVNELNAGLVSGDRYSNTCVSFDFLSPEHDWGENGDDWPPREKLGFRSDELSEFVSLWPKEIKAELRRQTRYQEKEERKHDRLYDPQPDGSFRLTWHWKVRHPIIWWKIRRGKVTRFAG